MDAVVLVLGCCLLAKLLELKKVMCCLGMVVAVPFLLPMLFGHGLVTARSIVLANLVTRRMLL